jgi:hypothetical protein
MSGLFASGRVVDLLVLLCLLEGGLLAWWHGRGRRGPAPGDYALNLASGICLMLALRAALDRAAAHWIALALLAAGAAHGLDLWSRTRRARPGGRRPTVGSQGAQGLLATVRTVPSASPTERPANPAASK